MHTIRISVAALALTALLAGCSSVPSSAPAPSPTAAADENPYGGFPVDPPAADDVVLTVTGTSTRDYTMAELEKLATTTVDITEPFVKLDQSFTGIPMKELFADAGLAGSDKVATVALNDYRYEDSADAFTSSEGMIAVSRDGAPIPMDQGGPIRIIYPAGTEYFGFLDAWNWSIRSIELSK